MIHRTFAYVVSRNIYKEYLCNYEIPIFPQVHKSTPRPTTNAPHCTSRPYCHRHRLLPTYHGEMKMKRTIVDGTAVFYNENTLFHIQTGKGGNYKNVETIRGNIVQAMHTFRQTPVSKGVSKRLFVPSTDRPVFARQVGR